MKKDTNNFYAFFPGGFYRDPFYQKYPLIAKITKEIDTLISETNFDVQTYSRIENIIQKNRGKGIDIIRVQMKQEIKDEKEVERAMHYLKRSDKFKEIRNEMIQPLYEKLITLGYDEKKLTA